MTRFYSWQSKWPNLLPSPPPPSEKVTVEAAFQQRDWQIRNTAARDDWQLRNKAARDDWQLRNKAARKLCLDTRGNRLAKCSKRRKKMVTLICHDNEKLDISL